MYSNSFLAVTTRYLHGVKRTDVKRVSVKAAENLRFSAKYLRYLELFTNSEESRCSSVTLPGNTPIHKKAKKFNMRRS